MGRIARSKREQPEQSRIRLGQGFQRRIGRQQPVSKVRPWRVEPESRFPMKKTPVGGTGVLGVDDRAAGIAIDRLVPSKHRRGPGCPYPACAYPQLIGSGDATASPPEPELRL